MAGLALILVVLVPRLGTEFLPYLDEGVIWVRANFPEGMSLEQTSEYGRRLREMALELPDVKFAMVQAGRNDDGTDPFPPSRIEMMIGPKPREQWTQFRTKQELIARPGETLPGAISHDPLQLHAADHRHASPRTPTARRPTWPWNSAAPTPACCWAWPGRRSSC